MSIDLDAEGKVQLRQFLGKRLRIARKSAALTELDAANAVGQSGVTQISLWEAGERMPPIQSVIILAKLYAVPLDWLFGLHNDPIADPLESNNLLVVNAIKNSMFGAFNTLCETIAEDAAVTLEGYNTDRRELREMCVMAVEALAAVRRIAELNPEFDEDWRGSNTLKQLLIRMAAKGDEFGRRIESERLKVESIDRQISYAKMQDNITQFTMQFSD